MSTLPYPRCYTCGEDLSLTYQIYERFAQNKLEIQYHVDNEMLNPNSKNNADDIFNALHLSDCCRMRMVSFTSPEYLANMNIHGDQYN